MTFSIRYCATLLRKKGLERASNVVRFFAVSSSGCSFNFNRVACSMGETSSPSSRLSPRSQEADSQCPICLSGFIQRAFTDPCFRILATADSPAALSKH